jgi:hypothetical protein
VIRDVAAKLSIFLPQGEEETAPAVFEVLLPANENRLRGLKTPKER